MKYLINFSMFLCCPIILLGQHKNTFSKRATQTDRLKIAVRYETLRKIDTIAIKFYTFYPFEYQIINCTKGRDSLYHCSIPIKTSNGYFGMVKPSRYSTTDSLNDSGAINETIFPDCYWEKGDNITVTITDRFIKGRYKPLYAITGKGALKYNIQVKANDLSRRIDNVPTFDSSFKYHNVYAESTTKILGILDSNRLSLTTSAYYVLMANYAYANAEGKLYFNIEYQSYRNKVAKAGKDFENNFKKALEAQKDIIMRPVNIPDAYLVRSKEFANYVLYGICTYQNIEYNTNYSPRGTMGDSTYAILKSEYNGILRDMLITYYLTEIKNPNNFNQILKDALVIVKTPVYQNRLKLFNDTRYPGRLAYNFNLPDTSGRYHSLNDFKGKVVFVDVWFTGCGACEGFYHNTLSKVEHLFEGNKQVVFVSVSMDVKKSGWEKGLNTGQYTSPQVVNLYTDGRGYSHPFISYYHINSAPSTILIDEDGRLVKFDTPDLYNEKMLTENINRIIDKN